MTTISTARLEAPAGAMLGVREADLLVFRGIPYAQPPVNEARFEPPTALPPWPGVRDCTREGPIAPQGPSRLRDVIGDTAGEQSEDCLSLTVWAPARKANPRPVMVWLHGGAYMTGAGALDCYAGSTMARNGDVVVVAPNFRQGALGFLYLPGVSDGNLGLLDLVLALRWVRENVAAFGGDPERVTLFGQSSGGSCIRALMAMPEASGLFKRAVLQSAALGRPDRTPEFATEIGCRLAGFLGIHPTDRAGFQSAGVTQLLAAQGQVARSFQVPLGASELPFTPVVDGRTLLDDAFGNWFVRSGAAGHALVVGYNAQEAAAGYSVEPAVLNASRDQAIASLRQTLGDTAEAEYERLAAKRIDAKPADVLCDFYTHQLFGAPSIAFAKHMAASGVSTWVYRFDWQSPAGLQACHCLELPFVFNNLPHWSRARMMGNADPEVFAPLAHKMQRAWTAFAHNANPDHDRLPHWPPLGQVRSMMVFDSLPALRPLAAVGATPIVQ